MKNIFGYSFAALSLMAIGMTGCQSEDVLPISSSEVEMVHVVAIADAGEQTRTSKPMDEKGDLTFQWSENDQIVIFTKDGATNCGVLKLKSGAGESIGTFEGQLGIPKSETEVHVYYFGAAMTNYLSDIEGSYDLNLASQNGAYGNHVDYDIMHALSQITRGDNNEVGLNFNIEGILSLAHFRLNLPEGTESSANVTVNGKNMVSFATLDLATATFKEDTKQCEDITVIPDWTKGNNNQGELYMAVIPGADIDTEFTVVTTDNETLKGAAKNRTYKVNGFFNGASVNGKDIYFSKDGAWTLTYMNGTEEFYKDEMTNFGPSAEFTVTDKVPGKTAETGAAPYVFQGWAESNGGDVVYSAGNKVVMNRPNTAKILYAVYNQDKTEQEFTLTGIHVGRELENTVKKVNGTWPTTVAVSTLAIASDDTYDFVGYYSDAACTNAVSNVTFNYDNKNITVYCKWQKKAPTIFTVIYTDGVEGDIVFEDQGYEDLNAGDNTPEFTGSINREGYQFMGWAPAVKATVDPAMADENGVITYTATWKKVEKSEAGVGTPGSTGTGYGQGNN